MKKVVTLLIALTLLIPSQAFAIPNKFKNCPTVKQNGITYLLYKKYAIVTKTPNQKKIMIPNKIKVKNKKYLVRNIWSHTFEMNSKLKTIDLKAKCLEAIEDPAIFENKKIKVITHDKFTYNWLKKNNVNVVFRG